MRIEQFLYLKKIAETGSINLACKSLFITQQALSRSIISLEEELETQLLNRAKNGVTLTLQGEYVLNEGNKILDLADKIRNHFLSQKILPETILNISSTPITNQFILSTAISYFYKNFPEIVINITSMTAGETVQNILNDSLDVGFVSEITANNSSNLSLPPSLKYIPIFSSPISVMISSSSPLSAKKKIELSDLCEQKILFIKNSVSKDEMVHIFFQGDHKPEIIIVDSEQLFLKMLADNIGFSFYTAVNELDKRGGTHPGVIIRPLVEQANMTLGYIIKEERYSENIFAQIFCEHLL